MKENGWMIYNMVKEMNHGLMAVNMRVNINKDKNMVMAHIIGPMEPHIVEIGVRIKSMVLVYINGLMEGNTLVIGLII